MIKLLSIISLITFITLPLAAQRIFNVMTYGAKGDGKTNDAPAIQKAIDLCSKSGGGRVLLPGRTYFYGGPVQFTIGHRSAC